MESEKETEHKVDHGANKDSATEVGLREEMECVIIIDDLDKKREMYAVNVQKRKQVRPSLAAGNNSPKFNRLYIMDKTTNSRYLIDIGSDQRISSTKTQTT